MVEMSAHVAAVNFHPVVVTLLEVLCDGARSIDGLDALQ